MTKNESHPAIDMRSVRKVYRGKVHALRGVDLRVEPGEVFGLLGPNGAGKSTLVKIMMTVISPTACEGTILGRPVGEKGTLGRIGYLPEHHKFPPYLKAEQVLDYFAALSDVPRDVRRRRSAELLETVGLKDWAKKKVGGFSKGMRQRLGIAQSLMNDPELVVLDEPTDGVDPVGRRDIRNILVKLKNEGRTVFLNSHLLSELEMVCDRVSIMVQGLTAQEGTIEELTEEQACFTIRVGPDDAERVGDVAERVSDGLTASVDGAVVRVMTKEATEVQPMIDALRAQGIAIHEVRPFRPSLEDLFMSAVTDAETGEVLAPGAAGGASGASSEGAAGDEAKKGGADT